MKSFADIVTMTCTKPIAAASGAERKASPSCLSTIEPTIMLKTFKKMIASQIYVPKEDQKDHSTMITKNKLMATLEQIRLPRFQVVRARSLTSCSVMKLLFFGVLFGTNILLVK